MNRGLSRSKIVISSIYYHFAGKH